MRWNMAAATIAVLIVCTRHLKPSSASHFTSTDAMEDLYELEFNLVRQLENYLKVQQNILSLLSGRYEQAVLALSNIPSREAYVANPINSFSLLRRLTKEWPKTLSLLDHDVMKNLSLPGEAELEGGVRALTRLQDVYGLSAETLANGHLPGTHKRSLLTAADCVAVAKFYYTRHEYIRATDWLLQAMEKVYTDNTCPPGLVMENLFLTTCFEGDQDMSSYYLQHLLVNYPLYVPPDNLVKDYNEAVRGKCEETAKTRKLLREQSIPELEEEEIEEYHSMCRGTVDIVQGLRCRLVHHHLPHLRLQPWKLEELHLEPPVLMFHQVISDSEIQHLQRVSYPSMKLAKFILPDGSVSSGNYRTSHIAWLQDEDPVSERITRRVASITNLDVRFAEMNQVSNYGLAGEYITHMDAIEGVNLTHGDPDGNRLATFMIYMSDVGWGGHTVFPDLGLSVKPHKGAALFWFNLHHDGSIDYRMRHASCPVIVGTKWVMNKWLHEAGQELKTPCLLRQNDNWQYFYL